MIYPVKCYIYLFNLIDTYLSVLIDSCSVFYICELLVAFQVWDNFSNSSIENNDDNNIRFVSTKQIKWQRLMRLDLILKNENEIDTRNFFGIHVQIAMYHCSLKTWCPGYLTQDFGEQL